MRHRVITSLIISLLYSSIAFGQQKTSAEKIPQYVNVPTDNILVTVASQLDCPLRIEDARFLLKADGSGYLIKYTVRNMSLKPIDFFTVVAWSSDGAGGTLRNPLFKSNELLMPGQTLESVKEGEDYEIIPLMNQVRDKFKFEHKMETMFVLMVDHADFADGSTYKDGKTSESLLQFLGNLKK